MSGKTVALFGGSFNPPHLCHILTASWAVCLPEVDEVRVIPVFRHAFGKDMAPYETRCEMLEAALAHLGPRVVVDRIEQRLSEGGGTNYTIDTVEAILADEPGTRLLFVGGADLFESRTRWKQWERLQGLLEFVVIGREGDPDPDGVEIRARLPDVSSTDVRRRVAEGLPLAHLVPEAVRAIIARDRLYREAP